MSPRQPGSILAMVLSLVVVLALASRAPGQQCDEGLPTDTGACCTAAGCVEMDRGTCAASSGIFIVGVACADGGACPGACCLADDCVETDYEGCVVLGGSFQRFLACSELICPTGACCLPDGSCDERAQHLCLMAEGLFLGLDSACTGSSCAGACCLPLGGCTLTTGVECEASGGVFGGAGTTCDCIACDVGACCLDEERVCLVLDRASCVAANGLYLGAGSGCMTVRCEAYELIEIPKGESGSQVFLVPGFDTESGTRRLDRVTIALEQVMTGWARLENLSDLTGTSTAIFMHDGSVSVAGESVAISFNEIVTSPYGPCEAPLNFGGDVADMPANVYCRTAIHSVMSRLQSLDPFLSDDSISLTYSFSLATFQGGSTPFVRSGGLRTESRILIAYEFMQLGACCYPDGTCAVIAPVPCGRGGGRYAGDGVTCDQVEGLGACCLCDESGGGCIDQVDEEWCLSMGGSWGACTSCADPDRTEHDEDFPWLLDCALSGACCVGGEECLETTRSTCDALGGAFRCDADCFEIASDPTVPGSCCLSDGTCLTGLTEAECTAVDPAGVHEPCAVCDGACLLANGECIPLTEADCAALGFAHWCGNCSECVIQGEVAATGACCLPDDSCLRISPDACCILGGVFHGGGSTCLLALCELASSVLPDPAARVCCLPDDACAVLRPADCIAAGGTPDLAFACCSQGPCWGVGHSACYTPGFAGLMQELIAEWGTRAPDSRPNRADRNRDGVVDHRDLLDLLGRVKG